MENKQVYKNILLIVLLVALLAASGLAFFSNKRYLHIEAEKVRLLATHKTAINNIKNELSASQSKLADLTNQVAEKDKSITFLTDGLNKKIDAFAKQAATCQQVKNQLIISGVIK